MGGLLFEFVSQFNSWILGEVEAVLDTATFTTEAYPTVMKRGIDTSGVEQKLLITTESYGHVIPSGIIYNSDYEDDALPEFLDDEDWITYIPDQDDELSLVKSEPTTSVHFGKKPENPETDINLQFFDVYYRHFSFPNIMDLISNLSDDIRNLATVLSRVAYYQSNLSDLNAAIQ